MSYKEIEVKIFVKGGGSTKCSYSTDNISHYKQYIDDPKEGRATVVTMLYLKNNPLAQRLDCGYDTFKKKLGANNIDLSNLSSVQREEVLALLEKFGTENTK